MVPSAEQLAPIQSKGGMLLETQVHPESFELKSICSIGAAAITLIPSAEQATAHQCCAEIPVAFHVRPQRINVRFSRVQRHAVNIFEASAVIATPSANTEKLLV